MKRRAFLVSLLLITTLLLPRPVLALDDAHWQKAHEATLRGIDYLRTTQNPDGSWAPKPGPAVTALVVVSMLGQPDISADDPQVKKAIDYILSRVKPDGSIHDGILENYNTSICLSALARVNTRPGVAEAIKKGQDYLRNTQWAGQQDASGKKVDPSHPFYGGAGYKSDGRPDLSNTQIMLDGLHDSGLDCNDPAYKRAIIFISSCQGVPSNKRFADKIAPDGGFIYTSSKGKDKVGVPSSPAGEVKMEDGTTRLATYGSMTYAGFKSYLYANLDRSDPRVLAAYDWIRKNYTLDQNPGMPPPQKLQGFYYYIMTFGRALNAWGSTAIKTNDGKEHDWANDLVDKLSAIQEKDGSWKNAADRWMEGDVNLTTAYSLIALQNAVK